MLTSMILAIVILLFAVFFIFAKRNMIMKVFSLQATPPTSKLQEELEKTADNIITVLEEKIVRLENLLSKADKTIDLLTARIEVAKMTHQGDDKIFTGTKIANATQKQHIDIIDTPNVDDFARQLILASDNLKKEKNRQLPNHYQKQTQSAAIPTTQAVLHRKESNTASSEDKHDVILAMAQQGYSPLEIAKATGIAKGEILLLLQLKKI